MLNYKTEKVDLLSEVENAIIELAKKPAIPICDGHFRPDKPFTICKYKNEYYPAETGYQKGKFFIWGVGYVKLPKELITVKPLSTENWYQSLIDIYNKYGLNVAYYAVTKDSDSIYNRNYTFPNLANAVQLPGYFDWITELHNLEMEFLKLVMLANRVIISGERFDEWHQTVNNKEGEYNCSFRNSLRFVGLIDNTLMGLIRIKPMFDPMTYENRLDEFIFNFVAPFNINTNENPDFEMQRKIVIDDMSVHNKMVLIAGNTPEAKKLVEKIKSILFGKKWR